MTPGSQDIALTTNGALLAGKATALATAGLRRVTVSLDLLEDDMFTPPQPQAPHSPR